jgi:hypothetical protein
MVKPLLLLLLLLLLLRWCIFTLQGVFVCCSLSSCEAAAKQPKGARFMGRATCLQVV